ncbi:bacteriohopanetetrol glucosamine biosynthesis glycosyltransferase HpnI [Stenomitos frigidus]|uniref:bacteriohopanetetrol glucosamine biosynthesis glycosyltransferase HpnI n=1 Tax=Stenomitos frigidus TaxID=1886765 RepID=UPI001FEC166C|nr:bacteriohopanetetrol glucosamine biosynthesis glycosyltransferase HpnI [Stenomitos frigidus]
MLYAFNLIELHPLTLSISDYASSLPLLFCVSAIVYYCLALYAAIDFLATPTTVDAAFHPPVSILKPLCGLDRNTYENLASFCRQDYPTYQIIFGIQDLSDPAVAVAKQIMRDFPAIDIDLVVSDRMIGANRKISNLSNAVTAAKHDILLIADSDIKVGSDYLMNVVQPLSQKTVGVVTCTYRSLAQGWVAAFEALGITTELVPTVLVSRTLTGMTFGIGATIVLRRAVLEAIGGFPAVANYLHDDFHLGRMPTNLGYQVVLSHYVVDHVLATASVIDFMQHQTRWNRGIRFSQPWGYTGQIFTFGTVASLVFVLTAHGSAFSWAVLGITWAFRLAMAWVVGVKVLRDPMAKPLLWLVPLSDLVRCALWCYSFLGNSIEWRGRHLTLTEGGKLVGFTSGRVYNQPLAND